MSNPDPKLTKEKILAALDAINALLEEMGVIGELCNELRFTHAEQMLDVVSSYYPVNLIPAKTTFFVEEIAELLKGGSR